MGKDSHNEMEKSMLSAEARQKFDELVALLAEERYGPDGPPVNTTFAEIEQFGHQTGRMLGRQSGQHASVSLRSPRTQKRRVHPFPHCSAPFHHTL